MPAAIRSVGGEGPAVNGSGPADIAAASLSAGNLAPDWPPLKPADVFSSAAAMIILFAVILFDGDGFILLLDHANLAFHEAGHLFFGVLGDTLGLYGGTLGQLVFPVVSAALRCSCSRPPRRPDRRGSRSCRAATTRRAPRST